MAEQVRIPALDPFPRDSFERRHIGPDRDRISGMLERVGAASLDEFVDGVIPRGIRASGSLSFPPASEEEVLRTMRSIAGKNRLFRSLIGMGYNDTLTPAVIQRNILENPGWYTQYTPYQSEISQGRLEALLNFQTMVIDLTGFPIANASLLDEATAAAEAISMFHSIRGAQSGPKFFISEKCHPQTIAVLQTRAKPLGFIPVVGDHRTFQFDGSFFGAVVQYPCTEGTVYDYRDFCRKAHGAGALVVAAADPLSLVLLTPPAEFGADAAVGNTQRFGIPMGYGGPHAAYFATREEFKRFVPGRIIGVSVDTHGAPALRMALQTREQHIRREKATSNICTAQALLAIMAGMYGVYHGPAGLRRIANRVHILTAALASGLQKLGYTVLHRHFFDTLLVATEASKRDEIRRALLERRINVRWFGDGLLGISLDEVSDEAEVETLLRVFATGGASCPGAAGLLPANAGAYAGAMRRESVFMTHPVFHSYRSETEMLRYIRMLEGRDLSLTSSMIPLGSCTMKLNATTELLPVTWPEFCGIHPFAPADQAEGYAVLFAELESYLKQITGFAAFSFQPNSGAQGEYSGLLVIRSYHESRGEGHRNVCLIPSSAHGTNPASAVMAGMKVVVVRALGDGSIDTGDLSRKAAEHAPNLAALMVTYPSTHGVFEERIRTICDIVHANGGQVYMDGANMNAQVGLCAPAELGADICHLNLHKTFCIPHGGGGPGVGPIGAAPHLVEFLPSHPLAGPPAPGMTGAVASAPWGSAGILVVSWAYIVLMGGEGLTNATRIAILSANYMAERLSEHYGVLYRGPGNRVAHEFILDFRQFKQSAGIEIEDVAKRLMDYGFHAPTTSFPVPGTLMIEPTESEPREELDRFCDALISIRHEIAEIERGEADRDDNVLRNAPHTAAAVMSSEWKHPYTRERAAFPAPWLRARKFWPAVGRINNAYGDKNLVCSCPPVESYAQDPVPVTE
ncbi:MAG TPA: aminomethyl-transferring glycine dehydrogenase [Bacteroidota bacterium]|nr:aminomethyl-transferring glycine dehydrogenase [Bacteroidota bacterium]